jgi:hypothetical protein
VIKPKGFVVNQLLLDKVIEKEENRQIREYLKLPKNPVHKLTHEDALRLWLSHTLAE